jgi:carbonic anhydrase
VADSNDGPVTRGVTRREAWKLAGAAAGVVAVSRFWSPGAAKAAAAAPASVTPPWNHNPASPIGPNHWGTIGYPVCGTGTSQSPVNIDTKTVARLNGPPLLTKYGRSELTIENTGHVVTT